MNFDLSHLKQLVFWLQIFGLYLHWWSPLSSIPFWSSSFSEYLKFAQVISLLLLSYRNFVPLHLIPIQILQKLVFFVPAQYLDQWPTFKLVAFLGSNNVWLSLLSIGKNWVLYQVFFNVLLSQNIKMKQTNLVSRKKIVDL